MYYSRQFNGERPADIKIVTFLYYVRVFYYSFKIRVKNVSR